MKPLFGGPITKSCEGCEKIEEHFGLQWCSVYVNPKILWARGGCFFNMKHKEKPKAKVRVGQQKSKRKGRK